MQPHEIRTTFFINHIQCNAGMIRIVSSRKNISRYLLLVIRRRSVCPENQSRWCYSHYTTHDRTSSNVSLLRCWRCLASLGSSPVLVPCQTWPATFDPAGFDLTCCLTSQACGCLLTYTKKKTIIIWRSSLVHGSSLELKFILDIPLVELSSAFIQSYEIAINLFIPI